MKVIVSLFAEASRYHVGKLYLNAAAVMVVDLVPLGILFRSIWDAFRELVVDDTKRF